MSGRSRKKRHGFLCFASTAVAEEEEEDSRQPSVDSGLGSRRRSAFPRSSSKIFRSNPSGRERKNSDRPSPERKEQESSVKSTDSDEVDRRPVAALSSSSSSYSLFSPSSTNSSSSSSSSCSASSLLASVTSSASPKTTDMPLPKTVAASRTRRSATSGFLLLTGLTLMVLYGRLCAILWTSSWFCYVTRRRNIHGRTEEAYVVLKAAAAKLKRRKWEEEEEDKKKVVMEGFLQKNRVA